MSKPPIMDADHGILYGMVALQANLIESRHLDEFMEACRGFVAAENVSVPDWFVQRGWIQPEDKAHLEYLVQRKVRKHGGDVTASVSAIRQQVQKTLDRTVTMETRRPEGPHDSTIALLAEALALGSGPEQRYSRDRLHATGGIGRVWVARDGQLERDVALKELRPEQAGNSLFRARFLREAKITGQLEHPGIVPVYELLLDPGTQEPFYTMRFVKGRTLKDAADAYHQRRISGEADLLEFVTLLNAFVVVCKTVAYAHSRGVIHRDLKGHNVMLGDFGEVVVLDWGLAKVIGRREEESDTLSPAAIRQTEEIDLTLQGETLGTPAYMAPEQATGRLEEIDHRTDVYGLGAMLYHVLSGKSPFSGDTVEEVLRKVQFEEPVPPGKFWAEVPATLEAACLRAMAKQPSDRFASASELAQEVELWQEVQRRKVEEELRVSQALYHSLVENIPIWAWRKDLESRFTFVNSGFAKGVGLRPDELIGKTDHDIAPAPLADRVRRDDLHVISTGETLRLTEEWSPNQSGLRFVEVIKTPIQDARGNVVGTQGILWDMTAWKDAEEELRESQGLYHSLVENLSATVWRKDVHGRFTFANKRFLELFGVASDALLGKTDFDFFPARLAKKYQEDDAHVMQTGEPLRLQEEAVSPGVKRVEVIKIPIRNTGGAIVGTQGVAWEMWTGPELPIGPGVAR
jgi:PAS domain S-box-containing protein